MKKSVVSMLLLLMLSAAISVYITAAYNLPDEIYFSGDGALGELVVKSIQEDGLWGNLFIRRLGAPEKSALVDTPFADWPLAVLYWICGCFVKDAGNVLVIAYCLTHVLTALTMFFLLRRLKCNCTISMAVSLLFSFSTYATYRDVGHLSLSNYFVVPLAVYEVFFIAGDRIDELLTEAGGRKGKRWILPCMAAVLLGFSNIYFAAFGLILAVLAVVFRMLRLGRFRDNLKYLTFPLVTLASVGLSLLPKIIYTLKNGANTVAGLRKAIDAEIYGLRIIQMLLPPTFSRFLNGADITASYMDGNPYMNENQLASLGFIATIVFLCLCAYFVWAYVRRKGNLFLDYLSLGALVLVLFSTVGGFGAIFNFFVIPEVRAYNRVTIYIICICLTVLAVFLNRRITRKLCEVGILALLLFIAYEDQITISSPDRWAGAGNAAHVYHSFYTEVENSLEPGAMVYQIPYIQFPEVPNREEMDCYVQAYGFIYTDTIRWSHGGMKGRNKKAKRLYKDEGISERFIEKIIKKGFSGVCVDLRGYNDEMDKRVIKFYSETLGLDPIISEDGLLYFYNLADLIEEE